MTIEEIKKSKEVFLYCKDVAEVFGSKPYDLHEAAMAGTIGFPVCIVKSTVKIPRKRLLEFLGEHDGT